MFCLHICGTWVFSNGISLRTLVQAINHPDFQLLLSSLFPWKANTCSACTAYLPCSQTDDVVFGYINICVVKQDLFPKRTRLICQTDPHLSLFTLISTVSSANFTGTDFLSFEPQNCMSLDKIPVEPCWKYTLWIIPLFLFFNPPAN